MSWLLENWFGSKESLEEVREDIHHYIQKESYLGISGIENPEQSSTRIPSKDLTLSLYGPWEQNLQEFETELLQLIHDELPSVVRDEIGVLPFFTNVLTEGYIVLAFIRNASSREVLLNQLPVFLATEEGETLARKSFDLLPLGPLPAQTSRLYGFMFKWEEFDRIPAQEVPLFLAIDVQKKQQTLLSAELMEQKNGLTVEEEAQFSSFTETKADIQSGEVNIQVLGINRVEEGGMKVIVLFKNGLEKRLEFTEVPIYIQDRNGVEVARMNYGIRNLWVNPNESRLWGFYIPVTALKKEVNATDCIAYIPEAKPDKQKPQTFSPTNMNTPIQ